MALIYADDFQQFAKNQNNAANTSNSVSAGQSIAISDAIEAMGFYRPSAFVWGTVLQYWSSVAYNTATGSLFFIDRAQANNPYLATSTTVDGLKRDVVQKGDTFFLSIQWACQQSGYLPATYPGPFLRLNDGLFSVEISTNYTYIFNGVDTGYDAVFDVEITQFLEIIVGPGYAELWNGDNLITRQTTTTVPIKNFQIRMPRAITFNSTASGFKLLGIIVSDSSGTALNTRIGRKLPKSIALSSVPSTQHSFEQLGGVTFAQTLQTPMQTPDLNTTAALGYGNVYSAVPFARTSLIGSIGTPKKIYAAAINIQAKRRELAADGMTLLPYIKLATTEEYGGTYTPRARWKASCMPMAITPDLTVDTFEFGFQNDFPASTAKVYVDDRAKVEVYGENVTPAYNPSLPYQDREPTQTQVTLQTAAYSAYVFDYAKSSLDIANTTINNLTYLQES
jgi:hypothetical protein